MQKCSYKMLMGACSLRAFCMSISIGRMPGIHKLPTTYIIFSKQIFRQLMNGMAESSWDKCEALCTRPLILFIWRETEDYLKDIPVQLNLKGSSLSLSQTLGDKKPKPAAFRGS